MFPGVFLFEFECDHFHALFLCEVCRCDILENVFHFRPQPLQPNWSLTAVINLCRGCRFGSRCVWKFRATARRSRMVARFRGSGAQSKGQEALLIPSQPCVCSRSLVCIFSLGFCLGILVFLIWLETTFHVWQTTALLWYKRVIPSTAVTDIVILLQFPHLRLHDL